MKLKLSLSLIVCGVIAVIIFLPDSRRTRAQDNKFSGESGLSPTEQEVLTEINQARAHPDVYAKYLEGLKPFFNGKEYKPNGQAAALITEEGWAVVEDAIRFLGAVKPQEPLSFSRGLSLAAAVHAKDQSGTGMTGHRGTNNSLPDDRVKPFGTWHGAIGEILSYGKESPRERVLAWLIDDGFASRGHRTRLLSGEYKVGGLSCGPHPQFGAMCVLDLAGGFTDFQPTKTETTNTSEPTTSTIQSSTGTNAKQTSSTTKPRQ